MSEIQDPHFVVTTGKHVLYSFKKKREHELRLDLILPLRGT